MPEEEQNEWPSFEAVLRDVAPSDVAQRTQAAIASSRRALSHNPIERATYDAVPPSKPVEPELIAPQSGHLDLDLPAPLPPLLLDTSAIRALLEPRPAQIEQDVAYDALSPLLPLAIEPEPEAEAEAARFQPDAEAEPARFEPEAEPFLPDTAVLEVPVFDDSSISSSAFDSSPFSPSPFDESPFETSPFEDPLIDVPGIELPGTDPAPVEVFDDLDLADDLVFDTPIPYETPLEQSTELDAGSVFELGEAELLSVDAAEALESSQPAIAAAAPSEFAQPSIDLFDLTTASDEIESDRLDLHGPELYTEQAGWWSVDDETSSGGRADAFDSVATANEIEVDLSELRELDSESIVDPLGVDGPTEMVDLDNVVQLRPAQDVTAWHDDSNDEPNTDSPPPPVQEIRPKHSSWVGLDTGPAEESKSEPDSTEDDPWAHMRPGDEPKSKGFWSRLPKLFGGDSDAKAAKAAKTSANRVTNGEPSLEISFESACPNCGSECQVDLDDPIGRRVHVSCPSCDHMWFTPYTIDGENFQTG